MVEPRLAAVLGEKTASATTATDSLSGDWTATMPGPNQDPVDLPFTLVQSGRTLKPPYTQLPKQDKKKK